MSGKDTHVRGLKILGAVEWVFLVDNSIAFLIVFSRDQLSREDPFVFKNSLYTMYETIR